ncbi:hypothetical protein [Corynebacterium glyciniphilum]|uniref:hypothetical protein n=1 Tax=Corynebacterium glyciniphilum TaxID=1404244 RepID=UPI00264AF510|nr:hypothetical protein [Corynebacterium glyciniphilum]MDN6707069.1 hypothetical protein [Corynebacterium glyciniphilum]
MTILYGHLQDVTGTPFDQQGTAVIISATQARPAMHSDALTLVELARIEMEDSGGLFETPELDPGPVIVRLEGGVSHGQQWEIGIPDDDERWNLADLIGEQVEWEPIVVSRAEAAARESRKYADQQRDLYEDLSAIKSARDDSVESAGAAATSEQNAATSEENASGHESRALAEADRSAGEARDAADSAGAAATSEENAATSEAHAKESESNASGHETRAKGHADTAGEHSATADGHRRAAATSEQNAKTSETNAGRSASDAAGSASAADQTVRDAVVEVTGVTEEHRDAAEAAAGNAASSASEGRGYRDAAREAAAQAEDIATGDLPSASESTRGLIQMTGDLAGSGDDPRVPALSLAAPGASVQVVPPGLGWGNAVADAATTPTGWDFDGEWLTPPLWLDRVTVTVDWCGGSSLVLRGRRSDDTVSTIVTLPEGTPETHRSTTVVVPLAQFEAVAVAATWTQEDLDAVCTASLVVQVLPAHEHTRADLPWWDEVMSGYVRGNDERLSDPRYPTEHQHEMGEVRGLDDALAERPTRAEVQARPAMWTWDGLTEWVAPDGAVATDTVLNLDSGELHTIEEVTGDE